MKVHKIIHREVVDHIRHADRINQLSHLIVLVSFLGTFIITRLITTLQKESLFPIPNKMGDLHIHHLVPGIILLLISGYVTISFWDNRRLHLWMAALFGIGAALTLDEFAMWLFLKDVYWETEGRYSVDAVIIAATIFLIVCLVGHVSISKGRHEKKFAPPQTLP